MNRLYIPNRKRKVATIFKNFLRHRNISAKSSFLFVIIIGKFFDFDANTFLAFFRKLDFLSLFHNKYHTKIYFALI